MSRTFPESEPTTQQQDPSARHLDLKQRIKRRAAELGFALCGVTTPDAPPHQKEYAQWLVDDMHGEMGYLATESARERRADPCRILPECESILTLAVNYFQGEWPTMSEEHTGRVARYAWNDDYHDVLLERLKELVEFIATEAGRPIAHKIYTDTGPLLERELAQRSGLGWIGKNTNLINPRIGSWLLLAEVLLDVSLPPDEPLSTDHCGTCTACIEACPTDAILTDPRRVDSRRCISYLTIETKREIDKDMRAGVGDWVFGCDICQDVCPWNIRFAEANPDPAFASRTPLPNPKLTALLAMSQEEFSRTFRGSPVKRTKRRGLLRNAAVALGNSGDVTAVPALAEALTADAEPVVRAHAAWALGEIASLQAYEVLSQAREKEYDPKVMSEIEAALERIEPG